MVSMEQFGYEKMEETFPVQLFKRMSLAQIGLGGIIVVTKFLVFVAGGGYPGYHPIMFVALILGIVHCLQGAFGGFIVAKKPITKWVATYWIASFVPFLITLPTVYVAGFMIGLAVYADRPYKFEEVAYIIIYCAMMLALCINVLCFGISTATLFQKEKDFTRQRPLNMVKFIAASHCFVFVLASLMQVYLVSGDHSRSDLIWYLILFFTCNSLFFGLVALSGWAVLRWPNRYSVVTLLVTSILGLLTSLMFCAMGLISVIAYHSETKSAMGFVAVSFPVIGGAELFLSILSIVMASRMISQG